MWGSRNKMAADVSVNVPAHLRSRFLALKELSPGEPPAPWHQVAQAAIGGLTAVGFGESTDLLLVTSWAGRGLFDCLSGQRIGRDDDDTFDQDLPNCRAKGIGPLADAWVSVAGVHGGGLAQWANGGWSTEVLPLSWPDEAVLLFPEGRSMWDDRDGTVAGITKFTPDVLRTYGFSPTGRSFVIATSSDVTIYSR